MTFAREMYEDLFYAAYPTDITFDTDAGPAFDAAIRKIQANAWEEGRRSGAYWGVPSESIGADDADPDFDNPYQEEH